MSGVERNPLQELKVGLFVFFFLGLIAIGTYILGGGEEIFASHYTLHTTYEDVKGMKVGAVVRLAGIDVGEVDLVRFSDDPAIKTIAVSMSIQEEYQPRIREDSVATIQQIGLLGDMYVALSVGSPERPMLADEASIQGIAPPDVMDYAETATDIVVNAKSISKKVDLMLGSDESASKSEIARSLESIGLLLQEAKDGRGVLHTLVYDKDAATKIKTILGNVEGITADVHDITTRVRTGDGIASALIYGKDGAKLSAQLGEAAEAVDKLLTDVQTEQSLVHTLLYDPEKAQMVADLQAASLSLKAITASVEEGEGTLGLLVRDPQLYEDVRVLMGGAQRNALLRAYIRATLSRAEAEEGEGWTAPEPKR